MWMEAYVLFKKTEILVVTNKEIGLEANAEKTEIHGHVPHRDSTVRGSNSGRGRDFPHPFRPVLGPTLSPLQWVPGLSRG